jgi:hypothetical protein
MIAIGVAKIPKCHGHLLNVKLKPNKGRSSTIKDSSDFLDFEIDIRTKTSETLSRMINAERALTEF